MRYDRSTLPPQLAALFEQIAATEARIGQLDQDLAAIRAGHLLDLPRPSRPDVEDTAADVPPGTSETERAVQPERPPHRGLWGPSARRAAPPRNRRTVATKRRRAVPTA